MSSFKSDEFFRDNKNQVLIASALIVLVLAGILIWWVLTPKFELLISAQNQGDLASATEELRKNNIPFQLGENGTDILVEQNFVSQARKLVNDLGVQYDNSVGLELFATSDFGITEFAQKINYKRALEGEITRTISALDEVRYARVHLVIPEKKLFDQTKEGASASVTLFMRDGYSLTKKRIEGIQSLVANSVPDIHREAVTILDQRGVEISHENRGTNDLDFSSIIEEKVRIEHYMRNKVDRILSKIFNTEDYSIEVDVKLSSEIVKTIEKRLLPLETGKGAIVLNKEDRKENNGKDDKTATRTVEQKFEYGSLLQETQAIPGKVEQVSVAVFIFEKLSLSAESELKSLLGAATGISLGSESNISIFTKEKAVKTDVITPNYEAKEHQIAKISIEAIYIGISVLAIALILIFILLVRRNRLTSKERKMLVEKIMQWDEVNKNA